MCIKQTYNEKEEEYEKRNVHGGLLVEPVHSI
jgi:hypothetical protein